MGKGHLSLDLVIQSLIQTGLEHLQKPRTHQLSGLRVTSAVPVTLALFVERVQV